MKLSIIIPVYNVEKYLPQCLDSIINQTFKDIEIICIDDCSTDNSFSVLQNYSSKMSNLIIIKNKSNLGVGESRNIGLKRASGEYIHFLDPDDWLCGDVYYKLIEKINTLQNIDLLFFNYNIYNNSTGMQSTVQFKNKDYLEKTLNPVKDNACFDNWERMCWLKLIRREFLSDNNIYFPNYVSLSDVEWSAKTYVKAQHIYYTDIPVVNYRVARENSLVSKSLNSIKTIFQSVMNNRALYEHLPDDIKYRMLAFDYFLLTTGLPSSYSAGIINMFELYKMIHIVNSDSNLKKYNFNFRDDFVPLMNFKYPILNFWKVIFKAHLPVLFNTFVKLKHRLFYFIKKV